MARRVLAVLAAVEMQDLLEPQIEVAAAVRGLHQGQSALRVDLEL